MSTVLFQWLSVMTYPMKNKRHKGNWEAQQKRRKKRLQNRPKPQKEKVQLIDGNWSFYPVAECRCHGAYLTQGLVDTHRCIERQCSGFKVLENE